MNMVKKISHLSLLMTCSFSLSAMAAEMSDMDMSSMSHSQMGKPAPDFSLLTQESLYTAKIDEQQRAEQAKMDQAKKVAVKTASKKQAQPLPIVKKSTVDAMGQGQMTMDMPGMDHDQMKMANMDMSHTKHAQPSQIKKMDMPEMNHAGMKIPSSPVMPEIPQKKKTIKNESRVVNQYVPSPSTNQVTGSKNTARSQPKMTGMSMSTMDHSQMNMSEMNMYQMDHSQMPMSGMGSMQERSKPMNMSSMNHAQMKHGDMGQSKLNIHPPANARNPDYSDGRGFGELHPPHMMASGILYGIRVDTLEATRDHQKTGAASSGNAWLGTDANRLVLDWDAQGKSKLDESDLQLTWRRPFSSFWNYDVGVRSEYQRDGDGRQWLAAGINGFAPYRFDVNTTALVGDKGRTALKMDADYDLRISQRVVLQPKVSASIYGKTDREMLRGAGFSDLGAAARLRYEISRQFAPYLGYQFTDYVGKTADLHREANEDTNDSKVVAGIRFWY